MGRASFSFGSSLVALALCGCSASSNPGGATDAGADSRGVDAEAGAVTDASIDVRPATDASGGQDASETEAGADAGPPQPCGATSPCAVGSCCLAPGASVCAASCGCDPALGCAAAGQCDDTIDLCCIQLETNPCASGSYVSTCLPSCGAGSSQLCNPLTANECVVGMCSTSAKDLTPVGLPSDAGYGICASP